MLRQKYFFVSQGDFMQYLWVIFLQRRDLLQNWHKAVSHKLICRDSNLIRPNEVFMAEGTIILMNEQYEFQYKDSYIYLSRK